MYIPYLEKYIDEIIDIKRCAEKVASRLGYQNVEELSAVFIVSMNYDIVLVWKHKALARKAVYQAKNLQAASKYCFESYIPWKIKRGIESR